MSENKRRLNLGDIIKKMNAAQSEKKNQDDNITERKDLIAPSAPKDNNKISIKHNANLPDQPSFGKKDSTNKIPHTPETITKYPKSKITPSPKERVEKKEQNIKPTQIFNLSQIKDDLPKIRENSIQNGNTEKYGYKADTTRFDEEEEFNFFKYLDLIIRRKEIIILMVTIFTIFSTISYFKAEKHYIAKARLLFQPNQENIFNTEGTRAGNRTDKKKKLTTHIELLKSGIVLERVIANLNLTDSITLGTIRSGLFIEEGMTNGDENNIVELSLRNSDPKFAKNALNELLRTYINYRREVNSQEDTRLIIKLDTQIERIKDELNQKENSLRIFKEKYKLTQLSKNANITVSKLSDMELQLQQTQMLILETRDRLSSLKSQIGKQDLNIIQSLTFESPMGSRLSQLQLELNTASTEYGESHFKVIKLKSQIKKLKDAMKSNLSNEMEKNAVSKTLVKNPIREGLIQKYINSTIEISSLEAKRIAQEQVIEKLNVEISNLPGLEQQLANLTRESESLVQTLKRLKVEFVQSEIRKESKESDLKILELAKLPRRAISSKSLKSILIGFIVGLLLGIGIAFILEFLDQTFKNPDDIEKNLEIPILGLVPLIEANNAIVNEEDMSKTVLEPFRALRTNIKHIIDKHSGNLFMISSAVKGEGKTTLSTNLAITFSLDNKKVIIVDCDLRRSQIHTLLGIDKNNGVTEYLQNKLDIDEIIKPTAFKNLSAITAGERPVNPVELLGTNNFKVLLAELKKRADIIIIDSPALIPVSDTLTMAPFVDFAIIVVRNLWTPIPAAIQAKNALNRIGTNIVGGIMNGVSNTRGYHGYYGYYGYYGYHSYKYTYDEDGDEDQPFNLRELGLKVEQSAKEFLRNFPSIAIRSFARLSLYIKILFSNRLFLLMLFILLLISGIRFFIAKINITPKPELFELIDTTNNNLYVNKSVIPPPAVEIEENSSEPIDKKITTEFLAQDFLKLLNTAYNEKSVGKILSFYSIDKFRFPGGGYNEWSTEISKRLLNSSEKKRIMITEDNIKVEELKNNTYKTIASFNDGETDFELIMLWQKNRDNDWKIIREKKR